MKTLFSLILVLFIHHETHSQTQREISRSKKELNNNLENQFELILNIGKDYTTDSIPFEVIKKRYLIAFKENLKDSLISQSTELKSHKSKLNSIQKAFQDIENENTKLKKELSEISTKENSVNFIGGNINKTLFFAINYIIIIALILGIIFLYKHYLSSSKIQANLIEALKVSEETINSNKKKGLNRELKLKREILELEKQLPKK
ncbi:hypothetical protein OAG27_04845 [Flavobacteriaceae bacterium]|nr:hypothetical protein [Flavobacteriaceae bacterium]